MEGRISRLDHHDRRFSVPLEYSQKSEVRWSTYSTSENRFPVQSGTSVSTTHRREPPLRSALKRPVESRNSFASSSGSSGSSGTSGRGPESDYVERSLSCYSFPNQASIWKTENPSRADACIEFSDLVLQQDTKLCASVDASLLRRLNESSLRTPIPNPPRKQQNLVSSLISRLRIRRQSADSAPTSPTAHEVAPRSQPPLSSQYFDCDIPDDTPTIDIYDCTHSDSDSDTLPSPNPVSSPQLPVRKTVRFAIWSHMRTFERPDWEPTGCVCEEVSSYSGSSHHNVLRKVRVV